MAGVPEAVELAGVAAVALAAPRVGSRVVASTTSMRQNRRLAVSNNRCFPQLFLNSHKDIYNR